MTWCIRIRAPVMPTNTSRAREYWICLRGPAFATFRLFEISDPFILRGQTPEEAKRNAIMHLYRMYDLVKVASAEGDIEAALEPHIVNTLGAISVSREQGGYAAQIPRSTLVAVGTKSQ